jgi:hypothetical protein
VISVKPKTILDLQAIAHSTGDLPALPGAATVAMNLINDSGVTARELQSVIARDQGLTAHILLRERGLHDSKAALRLEPMTARWAAERSL